MRRSLFFVGMLLFSQIRTNNGLPPVPPTAETSSVSTWYNSDADGLGGVSDVELSSSSDDEEHWGSANISRPDRKKDKNKPMKTLEKLQQMLDETDYMMKRQPLWTSSDRAKYKRQQKKYQHRQATDDESDEERIGYTLPDLPIYNSDAEDDDVVDEKKQQQLPSPPSSANPGQRSWHGNAPPLPPPPPRYPGFNEEYRPPYSAGQYTNGHVPPLQTHNGSNQYPAQQAGGRFVDDSSQSYYVQKPIRPPPIQQLFQPMRTSQSAIFPHNQGSSLPGQVHPPQTSSSSSGPFPQQDTPNRQLPSAHNDNSFQQHATGQDVSALKSRSHSSEESSLAAEAHGYRDERYGPTFDPGHTQQQQQPPPPPPQGPIYQQYPAQSSYYTARQIPLGYVRPPPLPRSYADVRQLYNDQYWQERFRQQDENSRLPYNGKQYPLPVKEHDVVKLMSPLREPFAVDPVPGLDIPFSATTPTEMREGTFATESETLVEAGTRLDIMALLKLGHVSVVAALMAYAAVSPRDLPLTEYNLQFYENLRLITLPLVAPAVYIASVFDVKESDFNSFTHAFFCTFSVGYLLTFAVEILVTTGLRLALFCIFEPEVFALTPKVALPILPWVLKDQNYRPKRITLFAVDFLTSCVLCPIVEESMKLALLVGTSSLPKNFRWKRKVSSKKRRTKYIAEPILRRPGEKDSLSANRYVSQMLAVSLALKLCDAGRRILLYTKASHPNKGCYSFLRGVFPIHELCGTMTALALAKRDLLGFHIPLWKLLAPAVVLHGMANFRGMKPLFKWNSATPWSEMQLSPLHKPDASTLPELLQKGYAKLMWLIVLSRVLGYCIKQYYLVNRQAVKRTTKYARNPAAFSAELATEELLKNQKQ